MKLPTKFILMIVVSSGLAFSLGFYTASTDIGMRMSANREKRVQEILSHPDNREKLLGLVQNDTIIGMDISEIKKQFGQPEFESNNKIRYHIKKVFSILFGPETIYVEFNYSNNKVTRAGSGDY